MNKSTANFYNAVAESFDLTRQQPWDGWYELLPILEKYQPFRLADLGCGNGRFFHFLSQHNLNICKGVGFDNSDKLLDLAKQRPLPEIEYEYRNIVDNLPELTDFNIVTAFGLWHHLESQAARKELLNRIVRSVARPGIVIVSLWHDPNYEPGRDYSLGWQKRTDVTRFCHMFSEAEIVDLMNVDANTVGRFEADGKTNTSNTYLYFML